MSKQFRTQRRLSLLVLYVLCAAAPAFAGGDAEAADGETEPVSAQVAEQTPAAIPAADSFERAVELAMDIPGAWDYDPGSRFIHPQGLGIEYSIRLEETLWQSRLDSFEYYVLRQKGTEYAFSDPMHANKQPGIYYSRATGQPLFSSEDKYDSGTGWPSFTRPINPNAIVYIGDTTLFAPRIEVVDSLSGSHLGHVFPDGPAPTGQRYCINAASLIFVPDGEDPPALIGELQGLAAER